MLTPAGNPRAGAVRAGQHVGDREITVREDKAVPAKSAPAKSAPASKAAGNQAPAAADGCRVYVGNLAWETTDEDVIGAAPQKPAHRSCAASRAAAATVQPTLLGAAFRSLAPRRRPAVTRC